MRLIVRCRLERSTAFPTNHQHQLAALVYRLLGSSDAEYARFLHDEGYAGEQDGSRRFKLFVFSNLRSPRRRLEKETVWLGPGPLAWLVGSPVEAFLKHCATGLLASGALSVAGATVPIESVESAPAPSFGPTARFTCLTPIVASEPQADGPARYLRPADGEFSEAARRNLIRKHRLVHGRPPEDDRLTLTFDPDHVARHSHGGTKKITYKEIDIIGAFVPFTLEGSPELMRTAWECGLGEKNSMGFGMIAPVTAARG